MTVGSPEGAVIPVRVAVRIRPLNKKEIEDGCEEALDKPLADRPQVVQNCNDKAFTYDFAYGPSTKQTQVFNEAVCPLVDQLFKGKVIFTNSYFGSVLLWGDILSGRIYVLYHINNTFLLF